MSSSSRSFFGAAALVGIAALLLAWTTQEKPPVPSPTTAPTAPAPGAQTAELVARIEKLEKTVADQQLEIAQLTRVAAGVATGAQKLAAAVAQSKEHGFEQAGPNPAARTDLLTGMNGFADAVKQAVEPPKPPAAPEKK